MTALRLQEVSLYAFEKDVTMTIQKFLAIRIWIIKERPIKETYNETYHWGHQEKGNIFQHFQPERMVQTAFFSNAL